MKFLRLLFKSKPKRETVNLFGETVEVNNEAIAHSTLGLTLYNNKNYPASVNEFTKAIKKHPTNQNFYTMRGTAYEDWGKDTEAEMDFLAALKLEPSNALALVCKFELVP